VTRHVLIVGASLGGLRLAEQLRAAGFDGAVTIVGAERHRPYNRPPLSKEVLCAAGSDGDIAQVLDSLTFRLKPGLSGVEWRLGVPAVAADLDRRVVTLADGSTIRYDGLGIATGLAPRRLPASGGESDRHVLRTFEDALRLRRTLTPGARVVVVGAGFIGCEVAASATRRGCRVIVVEPLGAPMERAIGVELGRAIRAYHESRGVAFRMGASLARIVPAASDPARLDAVELDDGTRLESDLLVEAVGSDCNTGWLAGNGLDLSNGVLTDNVMRVGGRADVVAVGDIARFPNPLDDGRPRRVEHWSIPGLTARRAAETFAAALRGKAPDGRPFAPLATFWSDQFDLRIQSLGAPALAERRELLEGRLEDIGAPVGLAMGYWRGTRLIGVVAIGLPPARLAQYRSRLASAEAPIGAH
jgi:NADPH-dependent 2,4-dienoyl-CoA reductase/sulfur reductase-like enzyme